jgi:hypothetical protein
MGRIFKVCTTNHYKALQFLNKLLGHAGMTSELSESTKPGRLVVSGKIDGYSYTISITKEPTLTQIED